MLCNNQLPKASGFRQPTLSHRFASKSVDQSEALPQAGQGVVHYNVGCQGLVCIASSGRLTWANVG